MNAELKSSVGAAMTSCAALVVTTFFFLPPTLLNQFYRYTVPGGSLVEKIHPGSFVIAAAVLFGAVFGLHLWRRAESTVRLAFGIFLLCTIYLAFRGRGAAAATFVDVFLTPTVLIVCLSRLQPHQTRALARVFVALAVLNALVVLSEFAVKTTLIPYAYEQGFFFRPAGFAGHPIWAGSLSYCAMYLVFLGVITGLPRIAVMILLTACAALSGVRMPLAMASLVLVMYLLSRDGTTSNERLVKPFATVAVVLIGAALAWAGALDRVVSLGLWEESSQSRVLVFDVMGLLTSREFWDGVDSYETGEWLARQATGGQIIENPFVALTLQGGAPIGVLAAIGIALQHWPALRTSMFFAAVVVVVSFTTLSFGAKNSFPVMLAVVSHVVYKRRTLCA